MRHTPTTLTNDFGSAPALSSEKSIFSDCAALAHVRSAARLTPAMAIIVVRLLVFILGLRFCWGVQQSGDGPPPHMSYSVLQSDRSCLSSKIKTARANWT